MTTLADIEANLPWGLHDAYLEVIEIDWPKKTVALTVRLMMTERQDMDQRGRITIRGLVFCSIDPPVECPRSATRTDDAMGLWIDAGQGPANDEARARLPEVPEGCFLHWIFVDQWNSFIHVCGRDAQLTMMEEAPVPSKGGLRVLFPGDSVPDPVAAEDTPRPGTPPHGQKG